MKKIFTAIFFLSLSVVLVASTDKKEAPIFNPESNTVLAGLVIDHETGESLAGVLVKIKGSDRAFYTDFEGNFEIKGLIPGEYELKLSLVSYKTNHLKKVDLTDDPKNSLKVEMIQ